MIISVTGLKTKGFFAYLRFMWLAVPAFRQAKRAKGNLFCETRTIDGVAHTLTVWKDRKSMKHFVLTGPHRKAMGEFAKIATGATITYEQDSLPSWQEALQEWRAKAEWY